MTFDIGFFALLSAGTVDVVSCNHKPTQQCSKLTIVFVWSNFITERPTCHGRVHFAIEGCLVLGIRAEIEASIPKDCTSCKNLLATALQLNRMFHTGNKVRENRKTRDNKHLHYHHNDTSCQNPEST
jgi:hypothetical protein